MSHEQQSDYNPQEGNTPAPFDINAELQRLAALRPQTPEAMAQAYEEYVTPLVAQVRATLSIVEIGMPSATLHYGRQSGITSGPALSRLASQKQVDNIHNALRQQAVHEHQQGDVNKFVVYANIAHGMDAATRGVRDTDVTEEQFNTSFRLSYASFTEHTAMPLTPATRTIFYQNLRTSWDANRQALAEDPTGASVIAANIARIQAVSRGEQTLQDGRLIQTYHIPEFVLTGAELGQEIYTTLYPLTIEQPEPPTQDNQPLP